MKGRIRQRLERLESARGIDGDSAERQRQIEADAESFMRAMDELAGRVAAEAGPARLAAAQERFRQFTSLPDMLEYMRDEARLAHADRQSAQADASVTADDTPDAGFQRLVAATNFATLGIPNASQHHRSLVLHGEIKGSDRTKTVG